MKRGDICLWYEEGIIDKNSTALWVTVEAISEVGQACVSDADTHLYLTTTDRLKAVAHTGSTPPSRGHDLKVHPHEREPVREVHHHYHDGPALAFRCGRCQDTGIDKHHTGAWHGIYPPACPQCSPLARYYTSTTLRTGG